jgi:hypothetical protein
MPLSIIFLAIRPNEYPFSFYLVIFEIAFKKGTVIPFKFSLAMFFTVSVIALLIQIYP